LYTKYALTGIIPLFFSLYVIKTQVLTHRVFVNLPLFVSLWLALIQVYCLVWNIFHIPWPTFSVKHLSTYLEIFSRLKFFYLTCSLVPFFLILKLLQLVNQKLPKPEKDQKDSHGSARLATLKEINALNQIEGIPIGLIPASHHSLHPQKYVTDL